MGPGDRLDAAEAALDDGAEPGDPRVEELAVRRCAHQMALDQAIEAAGLDRAEEELFEIYDADLKGGEGTQMSAFEAVTKDAVRILSRSNALHGTHSTTPRRGPLRNQLIACASHRIATRQPVTSLRR